MNRILLATNKHASYLKYRPAHIGICSCCGRVTDKVRSIDGKIYCIKHYKQLCNHGKLLDDNPRTNKDLNDYIVDEKNGVVLFFTYDKACEVNGSFVIDLDDLDKIKDIKWKVKNGYVVTSEGMLSRLLMGVTDSNQRVVYKNKNKMDNRKENLEIV